MKTIFFSIESMPDREFGKERILESFGSHPFMIFYNLNDSRIFIGIETDSVSNLETLKKALPGFSFEGPSSIDCSKASAIFSVYRKPDTIGKDSFSDIFDLPIEIGYLCIAFVPIGLEQMKEGKDYIERMLSRRDSKETVSMLSEVFSKRLNSSLQRENFTNSEELLFFTEILESLNASILKNGLAYNVYLFTDDKSGAIEQYINSKYLVLSKMQVKEFPSFSQLRSFKSLPFGSNTAKGFLNFNGIFDLSYVMDTVRPRQRDGIVLGNYMKAGVLDSGQKIAVEKSAFNLGTIITGLPGSGKTKEAMSIINSIIKEGKRPKMIVISPTDEWEKFASDHNLRYVKLFDDNVPINFFSCPGSIKKEKFYEDLAMILSSASNAGPYRNPMEKCMLNAFRSAYSSSNSPDPVEVYGQIEESIIKFHAKKTGNSVKYTKHGENTKACLENMRAILNRDEYASKEGIDIEEAVNEGIVFDLSCASVSTKPYIYALLLNQVYAISSGFDTNNDDNLNLIICLEEAQIIFKERDNAAVQDIKYRIQDFRKQGVGLILLAHNVNDIDSGIRRLCQQKLYLKQAPDVAPIAAKDLVFTYCEEEDVIKKLKHLDSRIGALSYVVKAGAEKLSQDTVFIKTNYYQDSAGQMKPRAKRELPKRINPRLSLIADSTNTDPKALLALKSIRLKYLGEEILESNIGGHGTVQLPNLIPEKEYTVEIIDKRGKVISSHRVKAKEKIELEI